MFTASKRALVGDLNYSLTEVGLSFNLDVEANELTWSTLDSNEKVIIAMKLSLDEFVAIASAVDVGRDIAFGEESVNLWEIWTKAMTSICAALIDCIENDDDVKTALLDFLRDDVPGGNGDTGQGRQLPAETLAQNMMHGCDSNNLYAATTQLVDFIHAGIVDFLELIEANTGRLERMNVVISAIPIVGILPADEAILFLDQLIENFMNNYAGQYNQTLRDEYACDLFCIAKGNCTLTFQQMADYFTGRAGATFDAVTIGDAIDWFIFGTWSGDLVVHGMHALFCWAIVWGSEFFGIDLDYLVRIVQAASNDSDPDWEIICEDCPDPDELPSCVEWNNLSGANWAISFQYIGTVEENAEVDNSFGNNAPSGRAGFVTSGSNHGRYINVRVTFDEPMRVQYAGMQYWYQDDGNDSPRRRISLFDADGVALANQQLDTSGAPKGAWTNHEWTGDVSGVWYIDFNFRHWGTNTAIYNADDMSAFLDNICMEVEPVAEDATPILNPVVCAGGGTGGTGITHNGGNSWTITTTTASVDTRAMIKDIYGRAFILSNIDFTGINPTKSAGWDTACFIENGDTLGGRTLTEAGWTWALGRTDAITFDMVLA